MEKIYIEDKRFEGIDFSATAFITADYENCIFQNCNLVHGLTPSSDHVGLAGSNFSECTFNGCNLSMVSLTKTAFRDVKFIGCKLLGLHFQSCNPFGLEMYFDNCIADLSSFYKLKLKNTFFKNTSLQEADFTAADLTSAVFDNCNLAGAVFENTVLEKADLSTAYNYSIDPELNTIKKAKFSIAGIAGLLHKYDIDIQ